MVRVLFVYQDGETEEFVISGNMSKRIHALLDERAYAPIKQGVDENGN